MDRSGYFKSVKFWGRVERMNLFPDIKVQVVDSFWDFNAKIVDFFKDKISEWHFVDYFEDFSIQLVDSFSDIRIKYVDSFLGIL